MQLHLESLVCISGRGLEDFCTVVSQHDPTTKCKQQSDIDGKVAAKKEKKRNL